MKAFLSIVLVTLAFSGLSTLSLPPRETPGPDASTSVAEVLEQLGDTLPHKPDFSIPGVSAEAGLMLVTLGVVRGQKPARSSDQSNHFVCTACHNIQREDPDLRVSDPQARLLYVKEKGIPFLQGTTLYGAVNRTSFYNGDYEKKYGELVDSARHDIRMAIQLCATECSQGERLEPWELESVLAYLWTIGLKIYDLDLDLEERNLLDRALTEGRSREEAIDMIKGHYLQASPATFVDPPENRREGYSAGEGNARNGKLIYDLSCKHCHENERYSFFDLNDSKYSFRFLEKHFPRYTRYSTYQVVRYGTVPVNWKRSYMPNYTLEKMSRQQLEDLRVYIEEQARAF
ncbi:MAG: cytochrome c [Saprospiraceae bacterium]|nr:cytochrome c [Saprospiraceae bacterium]